MDNRGLGFSAKTVVISAKQDWAGWNRTEGMNMIPFNRILA